MLVKTLDLAEERGEAVAAAADVVRVYEELARSGHEGYEPALARGVERLAVMQGEAGRNADAVRTGRRAVELYRRLVAHDRDAHEGGLAKSLHGLAVSLSGGEGQRAAAVSAEQAAQARPLLVEAAEIQRRLVGRAWDRHMSVCRSAR